MRFSYSHGISYCSFCLQYVTLFLLFFVLQVCKVCLDSLSDAKSGMYAQYSAWADADQKRNKVGDVIFRQCQEALKQTAGVLNAMDLIRQRDEKTRTECNERKGCGTDDVSGATSIISVQEVKHESQSPDATSFAQSSTEDSKSGVPAAASLARCPSIDIT